ncbi:hypothetical protein [Vibrio hibernica]|uniref:hypothetical protein n=1 Tax=Vibrio hibernica TaxID=2587465 RepID=UPI0039AF1D78
MSESAIQGWGFIGLILVCAVIYSAVYQEKSSAFENVAVFLGTIIGWFVFVCSLTFNLALKTIPIWGGAMILYWLFS